MEFIKTDFKDLIIIKHNVFPDRRGYFKEKFKYDEFENFIKLWNIVSGKDKNWDGSVDIKDKMIEAENKSK